MHRDFVPAIVDFDVLAIKIERVAAVRKHATWKVVARIAGSIVGEHEDDVRVGYAEAFHGSVPALLSSLWALSISEGRARERRTFPTHSPYANPKL